MVMVTFQKKKWRWIWNSREKNLRMLMPVEMQCVKWTWFSLFGMLLYPFAVVLANWIGLDTASKILGDMDATYFVSVAAIVMGFFGANAYADKKK